ncbi:MAG: dephospho-CoA kinase [Marinospirillum sp.]|uniref:dephospho-CoA kinase n=1 Tax=Marinospirillum sp. TaxID=2183934 RepID=UPI001A0B9E5C|nr:dephospho-CoA kinase [Marinospirillum sp.]MBE0505382.1 dephospho-CoA kinase [Marinospirillum sp.]
MLKVNTTCRSPIIGLTGGIGSGKTAASNFFSELGIQIIDADVIARQALEKGSPLLPELFEYFGEGIKLSDGQLNRAKLRELIFNDPAQKEWLEQRVHPRVNTLMLEALQQRSAPYTILSSPLLIESSQNQLVDRLLVIDVPESIQLQRTCQRDDNSIELVQKIMAQQISRDQRLAAADDIINNTGDLNTLQKQVECLHQHYLELARKTL